MEKIELFNEKKRSVKIKNIRDLVIGGLLFIVVTIIMAKMRAVDFFAIILMELLCIGIPLIVILVRNQKYNSERTNKSVDVLIKKYGDYSLKIDEGSIDKMTLLFPISEVIVIHGMLFKFSEIIDFSINENASYNSTSSGMMVNGFTGSIMTTEKNVESYKFNIILDDFNCPNFNCSYILDTNAKKLFSVLKLIIEKKRQSKISQGPTKS